MPVYWASFRIEKTRTREGEYEDRYDALIAAAKKLMGGTTSSRFWVETTSFLVFECPHGIDAVATALKAPLSAQHDLLLMRSMDHPDARIFGANSDPDIFKLMQRNGSTYLKQA